MKELMEKIGIDPALSDKKMCDVLTKERRKTYAQWHGAANNSRQKLLLRMRLEDIRKAETALHNKGILPKETSTVSANLSLIMALFPIVALFPLSIISQLQHVSAEMEALNVLLSSSFAVKALLGGILVLTPLAAFIIGIRSFLLTAGSLKQKIFSIPFSLVLALFFAHMIYASMI